MFTQFPSSTYYPVVCAGTLLAATLVDDPSDARGFGSDAERFQTLSSNDTAMPHADPDGGVAAGNDGLASGGSGGSALTPEVDDTVVASRDVTLSNGTFHNGRRVVGQTASIAARASLPRARVVDEAPTLDFVGLGQFLGALSDTLAETPPTGETFVYPRGGIELRGLVDGLNVFNISQAEYASSSGIAVPDFDPKRHTVVINVAGRDIVRGSNGSLFVGRLNAPVTYEQLADAGQYARHQKLLWNFHEADTLVSNGSIHGAILAPRAELTHQNGRLVGQVIAGGIDLRNTARIAHAQFDDDLTPEPDMIGYD